MPPFAKAKKKTGVKRFSGLQKDSFYKKFVICLNFAIADQVRNDTYFVILSKAKDRNDVLIMRFFGLCPQNDAVITCRTIQLLLHPMQEVLSDHKILQDICL